MHLPRLSLILGLLSLAYIPIFGIHGADPRDIYPGGYIVSFLAVCSLLLGFTSLSQIVKNPELQSAKKPAIFGILLGLLAILIVLLQVFVIGPAILRIGEDLLSSAYP